MLSVLLATKNRAAIVRQTLASFCALHPPSSGWKLIVVDNGSTDQTSTVLASFAKKLPLQALFEPTPGKSASLNAGLALVEGDLTVFTDDDIFPHPEWLVELRNAADTQPAYSMFGGAIVPRWETPPPPWIEWVEKGPVYGLSDSMEEGEIRPLLVFGGNMAIRSALFQSGIRFDTSIGPRDSKYYQMGTEAELTLRLGRQGHKSWHVPNAVVEHFIRDYQMRESWVRQRAIRYGRGCFQFWHVEGWKEVTSWSGIPRYYLRQMNLIRRMLQEELKVGIAWLTANRRGLFSARWQRNCYWGVIVQANLWHKLPDRRQDKAVLDDDRRLSPRDALDPSFEE